MNDQPVETLGARLPLAPALREFAAGWYYGFDSVLYRVSCGFLFEEDVEEVYASIKEARDSSVYRDNASFRFLVDQAEDALDSVASTYWAEVEELIVRMRTLCTEYK